MPRAMMNSLVCLSAMVIISTILLSSYLFTNTGPPARRSVPLFPEPGQLVRDTGFEADRLFDMDKDEMYDNWMKEFVIKGNINHPVRKLAKKAAQKIDAASASLPNSDDDFGAKTGDTDDEWRRPFQREEQAITDRHQNKTTNNVPKVIVDSRKHIAQPSKFISLKALSPANGNRTDEGFATICKPLNSVAMIKTHKCSSSTLQNILLRKAEDLNLKVAVPKENVYFGSPMYFHRRFIFLDDGRQKYNIIASHMRFRSPRDVVEVMVPEAKYITIFRDPTTQFESMFTYYGWRSRFRADMHRFLLRPDRYFHIFEPKSTRVAGRNPMCYDNGLDARRLSPGDERVSTFIDVLDNWYDLVLIAEYFDESLILLKDLMCWTLDDMVYFSQNARNNDSVVPLSRADKAAVRSWNWADQKLYTHFNKTLWEKIDIFGRDRMKQELRAFASKKDALSQDCIGEVVKQGDMRMWYPRGIKVNSFIVNQNAIHKHLCEQLTQPELVYLRKFKTKQIVSFQEQYPLREVPIPNPRRSGAVKLAKILP